ncbi:MAG: hypothetical protein WA823_00150, partial [Candidatus Acidiferrales bacterium]
MLGDFNSGEKAGGTGWSAPVRISGFVVASLKRKFKTNRRTPACSIQELTIVTLPGARLPALGVPQGTGGEAFDTRDRERVDSGAM